jgi:hypothetical protein
MDHKALVWAAGQAVERMDPDYTPPGEKPPTTRS